MFRTEISAELRFTGISGEEAQMAFERLRIPQEITAKGLWQILEDEDATTALVDGEIVTSDEYGGNAVKVSRHSSILMTPLMDIHELSQLKLVMNALYEAGAVMLSPKSLKIHFLHRYSEQTANKVIKRLIPENKLLRTILFFPNLLAPLTIVERQDIDPEEDPFTDLRTAVIRTYRPLIAGFSEGDEQGLIDQLLMKLLPKHVRPSYTIRDRRLIGNYDHSWDD